MTNDLYFCFGKSELDFNFQNLFSSTPSARASDIRQQTAALELTGEFKFRVELKYRKWTTTRVTVGKKTA